MTGVQKVVLLLCGLGVAYVGFVMYLRGAPPSRVSRALEGRLYRAQAARARVGTRRRSRRVSAICGVGLMLLGIAEVIWFTRMLII